MKIVFLETRSNEEEYIRESELFKNHDVVLSAYKDILEHPDANIISGFVAHKLNRDILSQFPNLVMIAARSTGYDHIDLTFCKERNIIVSNVPEYGSRTVAEFTFALILTLSRKTYDAYHQIREEGIFNNIPFEGFDLFGKTLGVLGTGKIGKNVVLIAQGFGMNISMFDAYPDGNFSKESGCEYAPLEHVLNTSDIVTVHVPYLKSTHHLLNEMRLRSMKKGSYLINTSRGPVIDTEALVRVLNDKHLAGAALDVLEEESVMAHEIDTLLSQDVSNHDLKDVIANHALIDMPNVIVTPHIAYNTKEANKRIIETTLKNISAFIEGNPIHIVQ